MFIFPIFANSKEEYMTGFSAITFNFHHHHHIDAG